MASGKEKGTCSRSKAAAKGAGQTQSQALRQAMDLFAAQLAQTDLASAMAKGYRAMGALNLALASEDDPTLADWPAYEEGLSEADTSGDP